MDLCSTVIKEIKDTNSTRSSAKDENRVMRAMLNDPTYKVDEYDKTGVVGQYCPYEDSRNLIGSVIGSCTGIKKAEAMALANTHEFDKSEADSFINISKEFTNSYLNTGRKLPLGTRESSDISIKQKVIPEATKSFQTTIGGGQGGSTGRTTIPAHLGLKVSQSCPDHLKTK